MSIRIYPAQGEYRAKLTLTSKTIGAFGGHRSVVVRTGIPSRGIDAGIYVANTNPERAHTDITALFGEVFK